MSVLIKGMNGYECCADCEFCGGLIMPDGIYTCDCPPTRGMNITRAIEEDCKHPDCQLAELPEKHGRLIDASKLKETLDYYIAEAGWGPGVNEVLGWVKEFIDSEPTILEQEGEDVR